MGDLDATPDEPEYWSAWVSVGGAHDVVQSAAEMIEARLEKMRNLDPDMYEKTRGGYLHYAEGLVAEVRVIAEWAERLLIDEAGAQGLPLAPFARITGRSTGTVSTWAKKPLQVETIYESMPDLGRVGADKA